jgi:predicted nucleic acid-binding protein
MTGTSDKTFVDTNVLIYAHDVDAGRKHAITKDLLRSLWTNRSGCLSTQVLQEFYVNATRKIVAVAVRRGARRVVSEDLNPGQSIAGITIHNPFKERPQPRPRR